MRCSAKSLAFSKSLSSGLPFAIPPNNFNGPNVSYPLHAKLPTTSKFFSFNFSSANLLYNTSPYYLV
jgi:hypothetical protein